MRPANLSAPQIKAAIPKLKRRLHDLQTVQIDRWDEGVKNSLDSLQAKVEDTLMEVFGADTLEYERFQVREFMYHVPLSTFGTAEHEWIGGYREAVAQAEAKLQTAVDLLEEKLQDLGEVPGGRALQVMEGLDLHRTIHDAAWQRYQAGQYADAIEAACKALSNLVQIKAGDMILMARI